MNASINDARRVNNTTPSEPTRKLTTRLCLQTALGTWALKGNHEFYSKHFLTVSMTLSVLYVTSANIGQSSEASTVLCTSCKAINFDEILSNDYLLGIPINDERTVCSLRHVEDISNSSCSLRHFFRNLKPANHSSSDHLFFSCKMGQRSDSLRGGPAED